MLHGFTLAFFLQDHENSFGAVNLIGLRAFHARACRGPVDLPVYLSSGGELGWNSLTLESG